ncbi:MULTISPECIES: hypothetical protein [Actinomycetes]|uniref:Uncharacterized protein n=2 Tax=Actinomycetes TaxID=1760 RepID=A0A5N8X7T5_9ACTN|nr:MULTISPECIES: hypothetical protein [Actinomycetes]MPY55530.1 hypothetical protein [Streptomyces acidicola]GHF30735.1 hypothetical protein GCM10017786_75840 [Amycolatopsis deserti]
MPEPGTATVRRYEDGTVEVIHADDVIAVDPEALKTATREHLREDGTLVLDTAGQYRYRQTGTATDFGHEYLVFERVR